MNRIKMTFKKRIKTCRRFVFSGMVKGFLMVLAVLGIITATTISTKAYTEDSNGNLVSENLIDNSTDIFEMGAVSYNIGRTYNENKVSSNARIRTINLIEIDSTKTYSLSVPLPYLVIAQGYNDYLQVSSSGTQFNQALSSLSFTGVSQVSIIVRKQDNTDFSSVSEISGIDLMFNEGQPKTFEPYGAIYYKNRFITDASVMDYTNIAKGYFTHPYGNFDNPGMAITGFIYGGKYGYLWDNQNVYDWAEFEYVINGSDTYIKDKINSNYGAFYQSEWNAWQLITLNGTSTGHYVASDNIPITLTYEFITPINLQNVGFDFGDFDYITFYDTRGNMLGRVSKNDNVAVTYSNVAKIVGERHLSDIPEDIVYIASNLSSGYYDLGYKAGYNNGYNQGEIDGKENAMDIGYQEGYRDGKIEGYDAGYNEASQKEFATNGFMSLLNSIMSYPVNMIRNVFNFEFMGINIAALITFIVSIVIVIYIVHKFKK